MHSRCAHDYIVVMKFFNQRSMLGIAIFLGAGLAGTGLLSGCGSPSELPDPTATGRELVTEFLTILGTEDSTRLNDLLEDFLADGFQIQRADGSGGTKEDYLASPAAVTSFTIGDDLTAIEDDNVLTVRWSVILEESIEGAEYSNVEAPRLSVFVRDGDDWEMISHANFNRPEK